MAKRYHGAEKKTSQIDVVIAKTPSLPITPLGRLFEIGKAAELRADRMKGFTKPFNMTGILGLAVNRKTKKVGTIIVRPNVGVVKVVLNDRVK